MPVIQEVTVEPETPVVSEVPVETEMPVQEIPVESV